MPRYRSFAKLNLHLEVLGKRSDGYHELRTVFQTVGLWDELVIERADTAEITLRVSGPWSLPSGPENLCYRAAQAFLQRWGESGEGVSIELVKRIPPRAGLGGGSSNAASVLRAMAELWGVPGSLRELQPVAAQLGADVPFFLFGGAALATGRGEQIEPLPDPPVAWEVWILWPGWGLSTAEVFSRWRPGSRRQGGISAAFRNLLEKRQWSGEPADWFGDNDLEAAAFELSPRLKELYTDLLGGRARAVRMSGSGSTLFALFDDVQTARAVRRVLPPEALWMPVPVLGRAAWREASGWRLLSGEE